jgi:hypothetical protein
MTIAINRKLVELLGIPSDAVAATLRLRADKLPTLTVTRVIYRSQQLGEQRETMRFRLVEIPQEPAP